MATIECLKTSKALQERRFETLFETQLLHPLKTYEL